MGTRSIVVITGRDNVFRPAGRSTARVYRHSDGYPSANLTTLAEAYQQARLFCERQPEYVSRRLEGPPSPLNMPAVTFAHILAHASMGWLGPQAELDAQFDGERCPNAPAVFEGEKDWKKCLGNQGDLEWVYQVELAERKVWVYGGYGTAKELIRGGVTNPLTEADDMVSEAQEGTRQRVREALAALERLGWAVNPGRGRKKPSALTTDLKRGSP